MFPLRDDNPRHGPAVVMWLLVAFNVVVFVYQINLGSERALIAFLLRWGFVPAAFFADPVGEAATLVSSMFLHGGFAHILGNMFFLFVFGDNVEDRMGHGGFVVFYLLGGIVATLIHGLFAPASNLPMVGASGAISAVLGAYIVLFPSRRVLTFIPPLLLPWLVLRLFVPLRQLFLLWLPAWVYIGYWALIQVLEASNGFLMDQPAADVAWWAHVGGFAFGVATVRLFARSRIEPRG